MSKMDHVMRDDASLEEKLIKRLELFWQEGYDAGIDDAAELLNSLDLPKEELAAAISKLKNS
jgi:hypothetical protein